MLLGETKGTHFTLWAALAAARQHGKPDGLALLWMEASENEQRFRVRDLADLVDRSRSLLSNLGIGAGARVLLATRQDTAMLSLFLAALTDGQSAVIVNPEASAREIAEVLSLAPPAIAFVDEEKATDWPLETVPIVIRVTGGAPRRPSVLDKLRRQRKAPGAVSYPACLEPLPKAPPSPEISDEGEAYVLFTSGSTARSKGVRISRRSLFAHLRTMVSQFEYRPGTRLVIPIPTFHCDGLLGFLAMWLCGGACLRPGRFLPGRAGDVLDLAYRERATHFLGVPTMLRLMLDVTDADCERGFGPDLRMLVSTGAPLDERLWERLEHRYGVRVSNFYGMTETVSGGIFCGPDDDSYRRGTIGKPRDCEIRLDDGELLMRGENVMLGYLGGEVPGTTPKEDGWIRTGDLAVFEDDGFVHIVGRKKNLVISGGQNIQPEEVTEVLEALPGVREAAVFGVPDELFGERLVACVVTEPGLATGADDVVEAARAHLASHKLPREVVMVAALPRGPSNKVLIPEARALFLRERKGRPEASCLAPGGEVWPRVVGVAARCFRVSPDRLREDSRPDNTPGWDSFAHLDLVLAIEAEFGVRLSTTDVARIRSLGSARDLVSDRLGA